MPLLKLRLEVRHLSLQPEVLVPQERVVEMSLSRVQLLNSKSKPQESLQVNFRQ
jgi:hypothetical protein